VVFRIDNDDDVHSVVETVSSGGMEENKNVTDCDEKSKDMFDWRTKEQETRESDNERGK
jgi:hypothetical protein